MSVNKNRLFNDKYRAKRIALIVLMGVAGAFLVYVLSNWSEQKALLSVEEKAHNILTYQSSNVVAHLNKFSLITALVSKRPDVIDMFRFRDLNMSSDQGNHLASITAGLSGAKDFWFVDKEGNIFSSSNKTLVGANVKGQSYFEAGFQGRLGRTSAVDASGFRSYIFASPVFVDEKVGGLVAVRVDLEVVEYVWALLTEPIVATESNGRILLSNIEEWRLQYFSPMLKKQRLLFSGTETNAQDLLLNTPQPFTLNNVQASANPGAINNTEGMNSAAKVSKSESVVETSFLNRQIQLIELSVPVDKEKHTRYLKVATEVPLLQWRLHVLVDLSPVRQQRLITMVISSLMVALLILLVWVLFERRRRLRERARDQRAFSLRLERQVRDRTYELTVTNSMLESEVVERRAAEKALRETQQDLMQAAKLAGIGQMSAALAHEYNQPLAAIRSYSDNALQLLTLQKQDDVRANLTRISAITDRMADLTKTLRSFAHKSDASLEPVLLSSVMDEMIILLSPQAKKQGVELIMQPPATEVTALAGHLRLSQVVINLVTNAMDAVKDEKNRQVDVSWKKVGEQAVIIVKDSGRGVPVDLQDKIFTPFFTTKGVGAGLGLGLFIVYNMVKEFQGTIELKQEAGYGGVFYIHLPLFEI
ncbi:MAG: two-component system C4-dicarboxylate transport sensor histidine kinase DctB [Kiritimatiellia bacterium]|jgi:two-component system C4-dicarboxylate transport sensor histidine kinase DctB